MQSIKSELLELLRCNDLLRATLLVGKIENPELVTKKYIQQLMELAASVWDQRARYKNDAIFVAERINLVLFQDFDLQGKTERYKNVMDDPNLFFLHTVMDKKRGSPLAVTTLYYILAQQVGLTCEVLAFPSHYLLKISDVTEDFYIDAFDNGKFVSESEFQRRFRSSMQRSRMLSTNLFEKTTENQLIARLVQHLKHIYILKGNALCALRAVELLTALFPQSPELSRDRGILYCEMEYFSKAMEDLKYYIKQRPNAEDIAEIKKLTTMLRGYRETMN